LQSADATQAAAKAALHASNFQLFQAYNEEFETNTGEIYKQLSLNFTSQFRYGAYSMMDLVALGADDPSKLIDIKEEFAKQYPNIAHDADKFLSGIQNAQASGVDASKFVVNFYAKAYEDFLELDEFRKALAEEGKSKGMSYGEMYANLRDTDATKVEIDRLQAKVDGFKKLGMYRSGGNALNHMYAVTKMHNEQQMMRLSADVKDHERVAGYGLELDEIESYYPEQYEFMDPKEKIELEKSLAFISASREPGDDPAVDDTVTTLDKLMQVPAIKALGFTVDTLTKTLHNQGVDIYNLGAVPLNYLTYILTGYNPGYSGEAFMQPFATATGLTEEKLTSFPSARFDVPVGGDIFGTPPGKFSWEDVDESLKNIKKP